MISTLSTISGLFTYLLMIGFVYAQESPKITSPLPGSTLGSDSITITWEPNDLADQIIQYNIRAGKLPSGSDYYKKHQKKNLAAEITGLPVDGSDVFIQLRYRTSDGWFKTPSIKVYASQATSSDITLPAITYPLQNTELASRNMTVKWNGNDLTNSILKFNVRVGSAPGAADLYRKHQKNNTEVEISGLPDDGRSIYTQLRYQTSEGWFKTTPLEYKAMLRYDNCPVGIDTTEPFSIPVIDKPTFRESYLDPIFDSKIERITNSVQGEVIKPMKSTVQAWNADETRLILYKSGNGSGRHLLLDGKTYEPISQLDITPSDIEGIFWSHTDPDEFFYISMHEDDFGEFKRYSVSKSKASYITDFKQYCGNNSIPQAGNDVHMQSVDDDLFGFRCEKDDGTSIMISYRISTDKTITQPIGEGSNWLYNVAPVPAPSGERFWYQGSVLDTDLETIQLSLDTFKANEHSNIGTTHDGNDALYQVAFNASPSGCNSDVNDGVGHLIEHNLETGVCRSIINEEQGYPYSTSATHISAQAYLQPGYVAMSSIGNKEQIENFFTGEHLAPALLSEIYLTDTDQQNYSTCRLAHHRSYGKLAKNGGYPPYFGEPQVSISPSGTRILFGSDWYDSGSVDTYVIELPEYSE